MTACFSRAFLLSIAILFLMEPTAAFAQRLPLFPAPRFMLLLKESIRSELKLTDDQVAKIQAMLADLVQPAEGGSLRIVLAPGTDLTDIEECFYAMLDSDQRGRLDELHVQQNGPLALLIPWVQMELKLTDDQKTRIQSTLEDFRERILGACQEKAKSARTGPSRAQMLRGELDDELFKLLTAEQQQRWLEMPGKKFQFIQKAKARTPTRSFYVRAKAAGASIAMKA